ncbi:Chloroperoxidase [Protomyces lactucae-debilis]|uniref:Chloroperoxidase n=1 Tax=Protomyces lactucae-debilis TaxID=2754530 RepID=A0A1Y2ESH9_PROLT|nr:Chloroperoxidase [Protomyces lactucae-debilis]ORY74116.1 Chloroperoxidase [Protomyces lactucae-debilis]
MESGDLSGIAKRAEANAALIGSANAKRAYKGDTGAYAFQAPVQGRDYRGPCPGLNAMANHGYIPRNGIATYGQLVQGQKDLYNVADDLANLLCTVAVPLDGDILTLRLSIGGAAPELNTLGGLLGKPTGLNTHNTFEGDTSLTRNDYFLGGGDNYSFNGTLFGQMVDTCNEVSGGLFDFKCMAAYRKKRYDASKATNPNFYFGPLALLLFGAASFLYELMPSANGQPDLSTMQAFFGASQRADGTWYFNNQERIPAGGWTPRTTTYDGQKVVTQILAMYLANPVLFGGNAGSVNNFLGLNIPGYFSGGQLLNTPGGVTCLLYNVLSGFVPTGINQGLQLTGAALTFVTGNILKLPSGGGLANCLPARPATYTSPPAEQA